MGIGLYKIFSNAVDVALVVLNSLNLGDLADVSTTGVTSGQILKYNGASWAPAADGGELAGRGDPQRALQERPPFQLPARGFRLFGR